MGYLGLARSRLLLGGFLLFATLISLFPRLDIAISRLFFDGHSFWNQGWQRLLKDGLPWFLAISFAAVLILYAGNRLLKRNVCGVDGRRVVYLLGVAIVGAVLIVNVALKDHFGRARPRNIVEFGGAQQFTPPFVVSHECRSNCSFSSGDSAGAFFAIALARALTRRRLHSRLFGAAAVAFGCLVSLARIAAGGHFFSDTVVSFFVMLIVSDVLWYYSGPARPRFSPARRRRVACGDAGRADPASSQDIPSAADWHR